MVIAIDANTTFKTASSETAVSFAHTCTGSDRYLLVGIAMGVLDLGLGFTVAPAYNGVAMASLADVTAPTPNTRIVVYGLVAPASGANNVTFTYNSASQNRTLVMARSFTGVDQSTPTGTVVTGNGSGSTASVVVSSAVDELVVDMMGVRVAGGSSTVGAGQTQRINDVDTGTSGGGCSSDEPGAASVTMSWTNSGADDWALVGIPIKPASGGSPALDDSDGFMLTTIQMPLTAVRLY